jgi:site-specific recombinase XerD
VVLSRGEVGDLLTPLAGRERLMGELMYGGGLRLMELLRLRIIRPQSQLCLMLITCSALNAQNRPGANSRPALIP